MKTKYFINSRTGFVTQIEESDLCFLEDHCRNIDITDIDVIFYISFDGEHLTTTSP